MDRDELGERLRRAAEPEAAVVIRIVQAALADGGEVSPGRGASFRTLRRHSFAVAVSTACLVGAVSFGAWWWARPRGATLAGVYRVEAVSAGVPDGVYRAEAVPPGAPSRVTVTGSDGTTWILSTPLNEDWPPAGSSVVIGGGEHR
jgi:hypothetical protein